MRQKHILLQTLICCMACTLLLQSTALAQNVTLTLNPAVKNGSMAWWTTWRPRYETNVAFEAKLSGDTAALASTTYTFTLADVSDWPGHCMNMGEESDSDKDLEFRPQDNPSGAGKTFQVTDSGQRITVTCTSAVTSITVSVRVQDWAAVGKLTARVSFQTGSDSGGNASSGSASVSNLRSREAALWIPLDNNGNGIADGWQPDLLNSSSRDELVNYDPWADAETGPGTNANGGDGFTVFEEYRGFIVQGNHKSTVPTHKNLFIYSEFGAEGIGYVINMPGPVKIHQIRIDEMHEPHMRWVKGLPRLEDACVVNYKSCGPTLQVVKQRALWVVNHPSNSTKFAGITLSGGASGPGPPHEVEQINIYTMLINDLETKTAAKRITLGESFPTGIPSSAAGRISEFIKLTIGHECGHGVGLWHPFDPIPSGRPTPRSRFHDRLTYDSIVCQYESSKRHAPPRCGTAVWDSGTTIMDYGSETTKANLRGNTGNRYDAASADYLAGLQQSQTYLPRLHQAEYLFVEPSVAAAHRSKSKPARKTKEQWSPTNTQNREAKDDAAPGAPQAPSQTGCSGSPYCNDAGRCSSLGNASQSTCGKPSCFCSGHASPTAPSATCGTNYRPTSGREAGLHGCNDSGACAVTGHSGVSSCAKSGCACGVTQPVRPPTGCGGSSYCNDAGRCSSLGNASQSTCGKPSCFCSGHASPAAPSATCGTNYQPTTGREAGLHGCNDTGACAVTGHSGVSSCAKAGCACGVTQPVRPPTGCGGVYCNDRGSCSSTGNASQSTCGKPSCFCSGHASPAAPSATCGTNYRPTTGREAGLHGCNDTGACAVTGHSGRSSCARAGCTCGAAADTTSSGNNTSAPPAPPAPPVRPATGCGGGSYCNDRGSCSSTGNASQSTCRRASCFCTGDAARTSPVSTCGTNYRPTSGREAGLHGCNDTGACAVTGHSGRSSCARAGCTCEASAEDTTSSGNNTSTPPAPPSSGNNTSAPPAPPAPPAPSAPSAPPCGVHAAGASGNHAWVSTCAVTNSRNQTCTNTNGYYECAPHEHTYPSAPAPQAPPCGVHPAGAAGTHALVKSCAVTNSANARCTNTNGYYACTPHQHTYPTPSPMHPCGRHQLTVSGNHGWVSTCPVPDRHGQTCTNTSGYYECAPHEHTYPAPVRRCGHLQSVSGNHAWVSSCAVSNGNRQTCTNTNGYYACTPHRHSYPQVRTYLACNRHTSGTNGSHHWIASCAVTNSQNQTCTNTNGYYACTPHEHSYPQVRTYLACNRHTSGTNGSHHWIASCAVTNSQNQTCTNTNGYYACTPHRHRYPEVVTYEACNRHTSGTNGSHHWVSTCPVTNSNRQRCTNSSGYYACSPHQHTYPEPMHPCGVHRRSSGGNHSYIRCPSRQNGYQCTGSRYACRSHTHTYPPVRRCGHLQRASGRHHWVSSCPVSNGAGQSCSNGSGYYACTPHEHTYPPRMHPCNLHQRSSGGNHSYIRCPSRQNGYQCRGYRYACQSHTHTYPRVRPCRHLQSASGNHSYIRCPSRRNGQQCTGYRYACRTHTHTYPRVRPCGHSYSSSGNHTRVTCPQNAAGDACSSGNYYVCRSHTHAYPARRPCGHSYSSSGNHTRVTCPRNTAGDACSSGNYYVCRSHTHTYPTRYEDCRVHQRGSSGNHTYGRCTTTRNGYQCTGYRYACRTHTHTYPRVRPCGHSYSSGGNHAKVSCPRNAAGDACSSGNYYVCRSHTHTYPARRPCGHSYSSGGNHTRVTCPRNSAGDACRSRYSYACKSHTHAYPARRPCGHLQSASGNHSYGRCTTRQNGSQCTGSRYACKKHTHTYRRPCGHLQSASGNHSYGRCTTRQNGSRCTGSRYACKSHTHTYRRPCGHLQSASGNHSHGRCTTTRNGQRCTGSRYGCKSHTHTYPTSSGNNSSGNNSSGNNSSGNNSSSVKCGNTWRNSSACSSGGYAPTRTAHRTTCRRGHTYWGCNPNAARYHRH